MKEKNMTYEICSDLERVSEIVKKIVDLISPFMDSTYMIEVALYEAIYNAIEHGNLEITRNKKESLINNGKYDTYLAEKMLEQKNCNRKVKIVSTVSEKSFTVIVEDEGKGFDWKKEIGILKAEKIKKESGKYNGFGLKIITSAFDEVRYNNKGNKLTVVKHLN